MMVTINKFTRLALENPSNSVRVSKALIVLLSRCKLYSLLVDLFNGLYSEQNYRNNSLINKWHLLACSMFVCHQSYSQSHSQTHIIDTRFFFFLNFNMRFLYQLFICFRLR